MPHDNLPIHQPPAALSAPETAELDAITRRVRARFGQHVRDLILIGLDLRDAKALLGHGQFGAWVEATLGLSQRTAERYMAAARLADRIDTVAEFRPGVVYELSAASTPEHVVDAVLAGQLPAEVEAIRHARAQAKTTPAPDADARARRVATRLVRAMLDAVGVVEGADLAVALDRACGEDAGWLLARVESVVADAAAVISEWPEDDADRPTVSNAAALAALTVVVGAAVAKRRGRS